MNSAPRTEKIIEPENLYGRNEEPVITEPFNPKDVDIISQQMVISNIIDRLQHDEIILDPDFQRSGNLWSDQKQSRLIESLIIRIPLPSFYFDYDEDDHFIVVDGLQRLWAIRRFAALPKDDKDRLRLTGLEYLIEYNGKTYEELPLSIQRRIREQNITTYVIRQGTPEPVRNSIFTRINTGGIQLTPAEIKNSIYRGQAANLLKELAHSNEFKKATGNKIPSSRMLDCEFVNRFLAFYLLDLNDYKDNLEDYLNDVLSKLKNAPSSELQSCRDVFYSSMNLAHEVFGERAFRKMNKGGKYGRINKPLFECVSVAFSRLTEIESRILITRKDSFMALYEDLLKDSDFVASITNATAQIVNIRKRNQRFEEIIRKAIK